MEHAEKVSRHEISMCAHLELLYTHQCMGRHVQLLTFGLFKAVSRRVVRGVNDDTVAALLQDLGRIHDQPLGTAYSSEQDRHVI